MGYFDVNLEIYWMDIFYETKKIQLLLLGMMVTVYEIKGQLFFIIMRIFMIRVLLAHPMITILSL
jgi:hypothetical protein